MLSNFMATFSASNSIVDFSVMFLLSAWKRFMVMAVINQIEKKIILSPLQIYLLSQS